MKIVASFILCFALAAGVASAASVSVSSAWSRPADTTGVVYATLENHSSAPDRLVAARSPIASAVELHESTESRGTMGGSSMSGMKSMSAMNMGAGGVASMHPVKSIPVPAHGTTRLAPGGYHVMLIGLRHPLQAGQTFPIRLHFADAGWIATTVHVRSM